MIVWFKDKPTYFFEKKETSLEGNFILVYITIIMMCC